MKLGLIRPSTTIGTLGIALVLATAGCSSSDSKGALFTGDGGTNNGNDGGTTSSAEPPHALGIVALGESHESGGTSSTPFVSASFIPDATEAASCTQSIAGCTVPMVATCDGKSGPLCGADEVCALDSSCTATCQTPCTVQCAVGEECYFVTPGSQACRTIEAFNAGALAFAGTTTPLTLYPPYTFEPTGSGSLFLAGAQLEVQGSGATGAGFAAFDQKFTATTFLQTSPSLSTLPASQVWGSGPIPVGWAPGNDSIVVSVSGPLGLAQCPATDSSGQFQVPRAVVNAVLGSGGQSITVSVTREHNDIDKNAKTQGTLTAETVQPIGFLEVSTSSTESFSFEGCAGGEAVCADGCVDLQTSGTDCGACGNACQAGQYCSSGSCYGTTSECGSLTSCSDGCQNLETSNADCGSCGHACTGGQTCSDFECTGGTTTTCTSCETTAEEGACASDYSTCENDSNCTGYSSCVSGCAGNTTCNQNCQVEYASGMTEAENLQTCICTQQCTTSCSADAYCALSL
jgi:hypothetical protein